MLLGGEVGGAEEWSEVLAEREGEDGGRVLWR